MDKLVKKAKKLVGTVTVPGSKSYTHRVLAAASLAKGKTLIINPSHSEANERMMFACRSLGAIILEDGNNWEVTGFDGCPHPKESEINIKNSGTALRFSIALASLAKGQTIRITGDDSLQKRPTKPLITALNNLGSNIRGTPINGQEAYAPVKIQASGLKGGKTKLDVTKSSQYLSSLLLVSPFAKSDVDIEATGTIVSKPYIEMTKQILKQFGIKIDNPDDRHYHIKAGQSYKSPSVYEIPGDYSQAAFPLVAGCLIESDIVIKGLSPNDTQGDKQIIQILRNMGARIEQYGNELRVRGPFDLEGIEVDLIDAPDLFPVLAVLGMYSKGTMRLYNMPQIRYKETDRIDVLKRELNKCGVKVDDKEDEITVYHADLTSGKRVFSARGSNHGLTDHRVAMALSLIGIRSGPAIIEEANRIEISYPDFFNDMESLYVDRESTRNNVIAERMAM